MLNSKYFTKVYQQQDSDYKYVCYRPKYSPMVLVSEIDGTPLASLHLLCQDYEKQNDDLQNRGRAIISKRPDTMNDNCQFQGLVNRDNQEIEFVITNLSGQGHINYNLLKTPTERLNQINVLKPNETVVVKSDKITKKSLVLKSVTKSDGTSLTLEEDESSTKENKGTYYHISIVPEKNKHEMCKLYEKTKWVVPDILVFKERLSRFMDMTMDLTGDLNIGGPTGFLNLSNDSGSRPRSITLESNEFIHAVERGISREVFTVNNPLFEGQCITIPSNATGVLTVDNLNTNVSATNTCYNTTPVSNTINISGTNDEFEFIDAESEEEEEECFSLFDMVDRNQGMNKHILTSKAATMEGGRDVQVRSNVSTITFAYHLPAENVVLGLSVQEKIEFYPELEQDVIKEVAQNEVKEYLDKEKESMLNRIDIVYESTTCMICMESDPDQVLYSCGHQCMHAKCEDFKIQKCPLCRKYVTARIVFD